MTATSSMATQNAKTGGSHEVLTAFTPAIPQIILDTTFLEPDEASTPTTNKRSWDEGFADEIKKRIQCMAADESSETEASDPSDHDSDHDLNKCFPAEQRLEGSNNNNHAPAESATKPIFSADLLAKAFAGITLSKPESESEKPSAPTPQPQPQPSQLSKSSPSNPFYRSDMTLALAAQNIAAYFREAVDWLNFWHISTPAATLVEISRKPSSTLNRIFAHLAWTAEFLRLRREGWDLRRLPDQFFEDVLPLVMVTCGKLEKLGMWKGCAVMMHGAWRDAEEVGEMLGTVREARRVEGREKWARGLGLKGDEVWEKSMNRERRKSM